MFNIKSKLPFVGALIAAVALMCGTVSCVNPHTPVDPVEQSTVSLGGSTLWGGDEEAFPQPEKELVAHIVVKSQEKGVVGELIRLDVSSSTAESFKWLIVPKTADFEVYDDGKRAVFSAREAGEYMFVVACAFEGTVDVTTHVVTIKGDKPAPIDPPDVKWPDLVDPGEDASLNERLPYWCSQMKRSPKEALQLAGSFDSVAAMISAGVYTTPEEIIKATGDANKEALGKSLQDWVPVLRKLQTEFQQLAADGELVTVEQHAEIWREVAKALKTYASLLTMID